MKSKPEKVVTITDNTWTLKISKERYIQVEERLNYRKAISSREGTMTLKQIACNMLTKYRDSLAFTGFV